MKIVKKTPKVAACLCDLEVIGEDEKTESECLPTPPPPTLSNSMRVSKIWKDHLQANERSSLSVQKLLRPAATHPIISEQQISFHASTKR